jgi:coenzyme F420-reducing hydrogenase gamma subunit
MNQTAKLAELQEMCLNEHMNLNKLRDKLQNTLHRMEISLCMTGTISAVLKDRVNIINGSISTQIEFIHLKLTEMHVLTTEMETQSSE